MPGGGSVAAGVAVGAWVDGATGTVGVGTGVAVVCAGAGVGSGAGVGAGGGTVGESGVPGTAAVGSGVAGACAGVGGGIVGTVSVAGWAVAAGVGRSPPVAAGVMESPLVAPDEAAGGVTAAAPGDVDVSWEARVMVGLAGLCSYSTADDEVARPVGSGAEISVSSFGPQAESRAKMVRAAKNKECRNRRLTDV